MFLDPRGDAEFSTADECRSDLHRTQRCRGRSANRPHLLGPASSKNGKKGRPISSRLKRPPFQFATTVRLVSIRPITSRHARRAATAKRLLRVRTKSGAFLLEHLDGIVYFSSVFDQGIVIVEDVDRFEDIQPAAKDGYSGAGLGGLNMNSIRMPLSSSTNDA
jgi:hypothetical protein